MISMELKDVDFNISAGVAEDETKDRHLDFDMFDYLYGLVCYVDSASKVLSPLGHPIQKFDKPHRNKRRNIDENGNRIIPNDETSMEHPRVCVDGHNKIILSSDEKEHFDDVLAVCDMYQIKHSEPVRHTAECYYWEWSVELFVPMISDKYPMMLEDYFSSIGVSIDKVMPEWWCKAYRSKIQRLNDEAEEMLNELRLEKTYKDAVTRCWQRGDISVEAHLTKLLETLDELGITYKKNVLRQRFLSVFANDEFEEQAPSPVSLFA